jgi:hypothetical protein
MVLANPTAGGRWLGSEVGSEVGSKVGSKVGSEVGSEVGREEGSVWPAGGSSEYYGAAFRSSAGLSSLGQLG